MKDTVLYRGILNFQQFCFDILRILSQVNTLTRHKNNTHIHSNNLRKISDIIFCKLHKMKLKILYWHKTPVQLFPQVCTAILAVYDSHYMYYKSTKYKGLTVSTTYSFQSLFYNVIFKVCLDVDCSTEHTQ